MRLGSWQWIFDLVYKSEPRKRGQRNPYQKGPPGMNGGWGSKKRARRKRGVR